MRGKFLKVVGKIVLLSVVHFVVTFGFFAVNFSYSMGRFDLDGEPTMRERVSEVVMTILGFPFMQLLPLMDRIHNLLFWGVVFILWNALWGAGLYGIYLAYCRLRQSRGSRTWNAFMNSVSPVPLRCDPFAVVAFTLAVLIMIVPVDADVLDPLFRRGQFGLAALVEAFFFAIVAAPFALALRRRRREPKMWSGRGILITAGIILGVNALWFGGVVVYQFFR